MSLSHLSTLIIAGGVAGWGNAVRLPLAPRRHNSLAHSEPSPRISSTWPSCDCMGSDSDAGSVALSGPTRTTTVYACRRFVAGGLQAGVC